MFQAAVGEMDDRLCIACGRNPSLGIHVAPAAPAFAAGATALPSLQTGESDKYKARKHRSKNLMAKLIVGWLVFLVALLFGARWLQSKDPARRPAVVLAAVTATTSPPEEDLGLLAEGIPQIQSAFAAFLDAGTPEKRAQFVSRPIISAPRMERFYSLNSWVPIDRTNLALAGRAVISLPAGKLIETQWVSAAGHRMDAVFANEDGEWRLDWAHFARAGDYPWPLFLAGSGGDEGEFRLLARERLVRERENEDTISIVFYAPQVGHSNNSGSPSPGFLIPRESKDGRLLAAAFQMKKDGKRAFDVKLDDIDPEELVRVRVKIRRVVQDDQRGFELDEIIAAHWYSTDAPGMEIAEIPPED